MNFTTAELLDIANNKPYGYFKQLKEQRKGTKKYKVIICGFEKTYGPRIEVEVVARNKSDAMHGAFAELKSKFPEKKFDGFEVSSVHV